MATPQVEIFRTNVRDKRTARKVLQTLSSALPDCEINFDLGDCDNVLRVEGQSFIPTEIARKVKQLGYECDVLE